MAVSEDSYFEPGRETEISQTTEEGGQEDRSNAGSDIKLTTISTLGDLHRGGREKEISKEGGESNPSRTLGGVND